VLFGPYRGVVDRVVDGDTVYTKLDVGFDLTVYARCRIFGINSPELSTAAGVIARDYAQKILPVGTPVMVTSHGWDKYGGRIDADLTFGSPPADYATVMLTAGQAAVYP
jgi:endonuclease YncB( thermonuclease family)